MAVPQQQGPPQVQWEGDSRWVAISAALLGEVGRMQVLTPTILVHPISPSSDESIASDPSHNPSPTHPGLSHAAEPISMTPPPTEFLPPDIIAAAKQWMTMAADRLAIAGAAHIDAFVHADKGEIIIIDVHTVPDLFQDSLLLRQVTVSVCYVCSCVTSQLAMPAILVAVQLPGWRPCDAIASCECSAGLQSRAATILTVPVDIW